LLKQHFKNHRDSLKSGKSGGFVIAVFILYLGLIMAIIYGLNTGLYLIKTELSTTNLCRRENLKTMASLKPLLSSLLALNPRVTTLRLLLQKAKITLATALASRNPLLASHALKEIKVIHKKQTLLNSTQKAIIRSANSLLTQNSLNTGFHISKAILKNSLFINKAKILSSEGKLDFYKSPKLSVIPDLPGIAPKYEPTEDFSQRQKVEHFWHYRIRTFQWLNSYLDNNFYSKKKCAATLTKEGNQWKPTLIEDR